MEKTGSNFCLKSYIEGKEGIGFMICLNVWQLSKKVEETGTSVNHSYCSSKEAVQSRALMDLRKGLNLCCDLITFQSKQFPFSTSSSPLFQVHI